ncbi:hypothetical protein [Candidatus Thalassolituus haligoni]|uniref:hypothetical protein n=1 Tax=Candidatus Thalassolituus haligoni TaxID=3100113 RepID=UPI003512349B|tara:strand:- start:28673 stop:28969 length:297 start_codon:yes stop_codon:yes gene_type:complete
MKTWLFALLALLSPVTAIAADVIQLEGISILGSTEDAGIMTITSWKSPPDVEIPFEPINGYEEERFEPLQPKQFQLEVEYAKRFRDGFGNQATERKAN